MSCCTINKDTSSSTKELNELGKHFDEVILEQKEKYQLLTLRDKCNKLNYDYVVWLEVKVANAETNSCTKSSNEKLSGACKGILDWIDILKNFEKSDIGKQLSLFEDDENELEEEPAIPNGEDLNLNKYFRDRDKVRKNNLAKQYSFFELFRSTNSWWSYDDNDFTKLLPTSNKEMIELVKSAIIRGTSSEKGHEIFDDYSWDDDYNYICRDGALSDRELFKRVIRCVRLYLVPYKQYSYVYYDNSYSAIVHKEKTDYHFLFDGRDIHSSNWMNGDFPTYNLYDKNFILWMREYFKVDYKEVITDDDILRENLKAFFKFLIGHDSFEKYNFDKKINTFRDWKQFKADIKYLTPIGHNGGGSGYSIDSFRGGFSIDKKGKITITQNANERIELGRSIDGLDFCEYEDNDVIVFNLVGDDIYKKAFELFNKKAIVNQTSLFDFMAA